MATLTHGSSVRYPGITVFCGHDDTTNNNEKAFSDPRVIFEVLSAGTTRTDLRVKLPEYKALPSIATIVLVDIASERLHIVHRTSSNEWSEQACEQPIDLDLPSLAITIPHEEIFARD